jgi:hypothetical protein
MTEMNLVILKITLKKMIEPAVVLFFLSAVSMLFGRTIRKFNKKKETMTAAYDKAFDHYRQKALESTNPKYLHLLYKQVFKIRKERRRDPIAIKSASETMRFILDRIDALPKNIQQQYVKEHHQHEHHHQQQPPQQ